jgi:hypothetical protein
MRSAQTEDRKEDIKNFEGLIASAPNIPQETHFRECCLRGTPYSDGHYSFRCYSVAVGDRVAPAPPAQIPACGFPAPGSCLRSNAIEVRGFGGPCTPNPQARNFRLHAVFGTVSGPGRALLLAFPQAGRPSLHHLRPRFAVGFVRGFTGTMQPSDSSPLPRRLPVAAQPRLGGMRIAARCPA